MTSETLKTSLAPVRRVVIGRLEQMRLAARALTPLVRVEEHSYDWGISWSVSALANSASDETVASVVVVHDSSDFAKLEADVTYANAPLTCLPSVRFSIHDPEGVASAAKAVDEFLQSSTLHFMEGCHRMMDAV